ncbi:hypothetical protein FSP39_007133 [Pinctada imbricata]|uniref:FAM194 C-terminal domain-containing protein n=1 Tax=Pinctada imbricata TaxID=66713 RepID=A0AA88Y5S8_PINIB|nr:hypothetical protein FSP39_007133 [Pinctada imbricata]
MEILSDGDSSEKRFPATKPLPPIGGGGDSATPYSTDESDNDDSRSTKVDDDRSSVVSNASSAGPEHIGSGKTRPAVLQGFRRESQEVNLEKVKRPSSGTSRKSYKSASSIAGSESKSSIAVKEVMKRKAFDGREVTFVTENTQTDWEWQEDSDKMAKLRQLAPREGALYPQKEEGGSRSSTPGNPYVTVRYCYENCNQVKGEEEGKKKDDAQPTEEKELTSYPLNDEYGVPMLELSSDSDTSSDDEDYGGKTVQDERTFMPSIGPPQILQYNKESEKKELMVEDPETRLANARDDEVPIGEMDDQGRLLGMFGGTCEFCGHEIQPFPTLEQQQTLPPDQLYCCNQYREFVEFTITANNAIEEEHKKKNKKINISTHAHYGSSKEERKVARERALQRMREKEQQRKQQEASGFQQQSNFYSYDSTNIDTKIHPSPHKNILRQSAGSATRALSRESSHKTSKNVAALFKSEKPESRSGLAVAQKMKTINYQLSSQKCLEEGWTIRPPSPLFPEEEDDTFIPEPINMELLRSGKLGLVEKYYESGQKFLTMFPDGTGNVFYPSGNLAVIVSSITLGHFTYVVQADTERTQVLAVFEPNGYATCYHNNGIVRLYMDQLGGIELDYMGARKRKWHWKDQANHVHAPPFQPIHFGLNHYVGVRILAQDKMVLTFSAKDRSKYFNVGARLKLNNIESLPPKEIDDSMLFLDEKKVKVESLLDKVSMLLKFPKSPKVDKILPPLHIASKALKTERLKKERAEQILAAEAKKNKQPAIVVN